MDQEMSLLKKELRKTMKAVLNVVDREEVERQSRLLTEKVLSSPRYSQSKRVSIYVSTTGEIVTDTLIRNAFQSGKQVFVPQFIKGNFAMRMVGLSSQDVFDKLPVTLWSIRQPAVDQTWEDYFYSGPLDLVLLPGVAFTTDGKRLGHGMGYYDRWLADHEKRFGVRPYTVGLALEQQILPSVPVSDTDVLMDEVLTA